MDFGRAAREAREKLGLTVNRVSAILEAMKMPKYGSGYLYQIEKGERRPPRSDAYIKAWAELLEEEPDWFFYLAGRIPPDVRGASKEKVLEAFRILRDSD